ncbi:MAG: DUF2066 domain-containing protein [Rhodospirillales bacterium]
MILDTCFHLFRSRRLEGAFSALILSLALTAGCGTDAAADVFTVANLRVDVTSETATKARDTAIRTGEQRAFDILLNRLTLPEDRALLPDFSHNEAASYILDMAVAGEKTSSVRYLANLTFRFRANDVRTLLSGRGIPFAETEAPPLLVLPVLESNGIRQLFAETGTNPWAAAWADQTIGQGLVPIVRPLGDLEDLSLINAESAVRGDEKALSAIAERNGAAEVLVAIARLGRESVRGLPELTVVTRRYRADGQPLQSEQRYPALANETEEALLARAARDTVRQLDDAWKQGNLLDAAQESFMAVVVPLKGLPDWLDIKNRLSKVSIIRDTQVVLLARDRARVNLLFVGAEDQLRSALGQQDLTLYRAGFDMVVDRRGRTPYQGQPLLSPVAPSLMPAADPGATSETGPTPPVGNSGIR